MQHYILEKIEIRVRWSVKKMTKNKYKPKKVQNSKIVIQEKLKFLIPSKAISADLKIKHSDVWLKTRITYSIKNKLIYSEHKLKYQKFLEPKVKNSNKILNPKRLQQVVVGVCERKCKQWGSYTRIFMPQCAAAAAGRRGGYAT